jgi:hypothetical protein
VIEEPVVDNDVIPENKRVIDAEGGYDDPEEGMRAERIALAGRN